MVPQQAFKPVAEAFIQYGKDVEASFKAPTNNSVQAMVGGVALAELKELNTRNATAPIIKTDSCKLILNNLTGQPFKLYLHTGNVLLGENVSTLDLKIGEQYYLFLSDVSKIFIKLTASNAIESYVYGEKTNAQYNIGTMTQSYNLSNLYLLPSASSNHALLAN